MATSFMNKPSYGSAFDQDHDANSALTELDKALRSGQIGLQCEAVIKFPRLFEKYPFPILINSAMLKIADVFRVGNNFIRLCILRVAQQSEKHLDKIFSVDEFTRRIFGVIHSNDPIARAITLRILGSMANIIAEKKTVHHSILQYLDSHNSTEIEAAIFAAERFCKTSKNFAEEVCGTIGSMIVRLEIPAEMKLQLIPILKHMHHDAKTTEKALDLCQSVIDTYPAQNFVILAIKTMTQLTIESLIGIQSHVTRLLNLLNSDPRRSVKAACLDDMKLLAERAAYLWTQKNLNDVAKFSLETTILSLKVKAACVLNAAFADVAVNHQHLQSDSSILDVCLTFCYHPCGILSSQATHLLTQLARHKSTKGGGSDLTLEAVGIIQAQLILLSSHDKQGNTDLRQLRLVLKCAAEICWHEAAASSRIVPTLISLLAVTSESSQLSISECLAAIGSHSPSAIDAVTPSILANLSAAIGDSSKKIGQIQVHLCTLLFQARCHDQMSGLISGQVKSCIEKASPWIAYKVARQAMRYCQYQVAYDILSTIHLEAQAVTEHTSNWLLGLQHACAAEKALKEATKNNENMMSSIEKAVHFYTKSHVALKAAITPSSSMDFACRYIKVRMAGLQAHHMLLLTCVSFSAKPPPFIVTAQASNTGVEGLRWNQVVQQLEKCLKAYKDASQLTFTLYRSSFDADSASLQNISVIQQCCDCMKSIISTIMSAIHTGQSNLGERQFLIKKNSESFSGSVWNQLSPSTSSSSSTKASFRETATINVMHEISEALDKLLPDCSAHVSVSHKLIEFLSSSVYSLVHTSPSFPRFVFQSLQSTVVKLALSPQQGSNQEPIPLRADTHLSLKVEGVVQRGDRPALFRSVHSVTITVSPSLVSRSLPVSNVKGNEGTSVPLSQTVQPHNDYFSTNFVLPFAIPGIHTAKIEVSVIDENGILWNTGPQTSVTIKSYDDNIQRQHQQMRAQARTQQQQTTGGAQQSHYGPNALPGHS